MTKKIITCIPLVIYLAGPVNILCMKKNTSTNQNAIYIKSSPVRRVYTHIPPSHISPTTHTCQNKCFEQKIPVRKNPYHRGYPSNRIPPRAPFIEMIKTTYTKNYSRLRVETIQENTNKEFENLLEEIDIVCKKQFDNSYQNSYQNKFEKLLIEKDQIDEKQHDNNQAYENHLHSNQTLLTNTPTIITSEKKYEYFKKIFFEPSYKTISASERKIKTLENSIFFSFNRQPSKECTTTITPDDWKKLYSIMKLVFE